MIVIIILRLLIFLVFSQYFFKYSKSQHIEINSTRKFLWENKVQQKCLCNYKWIGKMQVRKNQELTLYLNFTALWAEKICKRSAIFYLFLIRATDIFTFTMFLLRFISGPFPPPFQCPIWYNLSVPNNRQS